MLALVDQDGVVHCTAPGLADRARITLDQCRAGLQRLSDPDQDSLTMEYEGRRIRRVDNGFLILNYEKYRHLMSEEDRREKTRIRVQRFRDRRNVTLCNAGNDIAEAEAKAKEEQTFSPIGAANNEFSLSEDDLSAIPNHRKKKQVDPRHQPFRDHLEKFWAWKNPKLPMFSWSAADAKQLSELLKRWPELTGKQFKWWLVNYSESEDITASKTPRQFLPFIHDYASGPRNKYHNPKEEQNV